MKVFHIGLWLDHIGITYNMMDLICSAYDVGVGNVARTHLK